MAGDPRSPARGYSGFGPSLADAVRGRIDSPAGLQPAGEGGDVGRDDPQARPAGDERVCNTGAADMTCAVRGVAPCDHIQSIERPGHCAKCGIACRWTNWGFAPRLVEE